MWERRIDHPLDSRQSRRHFKTPFFVRQDSPGICDTTMNKETHLLLGARGTPKVHEKCEWINQDVLEEVDAKSGSLGAQKRKATFVTEFLPPRPYNPVWRRKSVYDSLPFMPVRSCKVNQRRPNQRVKVRTSHQSLA